MYNANKSSATDVTTISLMQQAMYDYLSEPELSITAPAKSHNLDPCTFSRVLKKWQKMCPGVRPSCPAAVRLPKRLVGLPRLFSTEDEDLMEKEIVKYSDAGLPLTTQLILMLAEFCIEAQQKHFKNPGKPSRGWVDGLIRRRKALRKRCMQLIEDKRVQAIVPSRVGEHIGRTIAILKRFRITDPKQVIKINECGNSFKK